MIATVIIACVLAPSAQAMAAESAKGKQRPCPPAGQRLDAITVTPGPVSSERSITWSPHVAADTYRLVENRTVAGTCAATVSSLAPSMGVLETGEGFSYDASGLVRPHDPGSFFEPAALDGPAPEAPGQFLMAKRVDFRRTAQRLVTDYIGLWRNGAQWTVASFSQRGSETAGPVKPVLKSTVPVISVTYFPAPDTQAGQIALTLRQSATTTSLLAYNWSHRQWFD